MDISITVDDGDPVDLRNPRFELLSPQRTVEVADVVRDGHDHEHSRTTSTRTTRALT